MRPPGGYTPDMMNYANDIDVYKIWANMVAYDHGYFDPSHRPYFCVHTGRRHRLAYQHTLAEVHQRYEKAIVMAETMPEVLAPAMGNDMITARFADYDAMMEFVDFTMSKE